MKVMFAANFGMGFYKFRKELIEELIQAGHEVYVLLPQDRYTSYLEDLGCTVIDIKVDRRGINPIKDVSTFVEYLKVFRQLKPDYLFTYTIKPNIYGGLAARLLNIPYSATITGLGTAMETETILSKVLSALYSISLKKAESVFFQNQKNASHFIDKKLYAGKINLVPGSGVNTEEYALIDYPTQDEDIEFLYIGRLMRAKGIDELLSAAKRVYELYPKATFNIVGFAEAEYEDELNQDYPNVIFHGPQEDIKPFLKQAHALVLPSHHEGLANVLLEAASIGRPVIASDIPGCIETFEDRQSGIAFMVKNEMSLFEALIEFIEMPYDDKQKMGLLGRKKIVSEFDRSIVVKEYLNQIKEAIY